MPRAVRGAALAAGTPAASDEESTWLSGFTLPANDGDRARVLAELGGPQKAFYSMRQAAIEAARASSAAFVAYAIKDESTDLPLEPVPMHAEWHELADTYDRLVIWSHLEAGKTSQLSIGRVIWQLGKDPNRRIVVVSGTEKNAKKILRSVAQNIERNPLVREVFPHLRRHPDPSMPWNSLAITIARNVIAKDASLQCLGVGGTFEGARISDLYLDDILTFNNTRTKERREGVREWMMSTLIGRVAEGGTVLCVGNAFDPDDAMHSLVKASGYQGAKFEVVDGAGRPRWPARWPVRRILRKKKELGQIEADRQLFCKARSDANARFKRAWIDKCLDLGVGYKLVGRITRDLPSNYIILTGVDLAVQERRDSDTTVFFTLLLHPDGRRQVLNIVAGRWGGPEIVKRIEEVDRRYGGIVMVENVAAQHYIVQFARELTRAVVVPFTTGRNKADPRFGVESLATEMEAGRWIIPCASGRRTDPEVEAWISEMLYYSPTAHTGDRLMAGWFAREAARRVERGRLDDEGEEPEGEEDAEEEEDASLAELSVEELRAREARSRRAHLA